ncbi:receptor family ligand binding region domain-containing protein [Ditylenchus destructor]|uniref:Receptor family ligand binding region domain-containing protein n=1 Tax=Ditylenchus destructor TaxID=166010 RepID=A0AAD4N9L8_9BILA|nr:receptor family ligand binding region domain-containing protein [Ditylenchus destructor]
MQRHSGIRQHKHGTLNLLSILTALFFAFFIQSLCYTGSNAYSNSSGDNGTLLIPIEALNSNNYVSISANLTRVSRAVRSLQAPYMFPLHGAVFLPHDAELITDDGEPPERHLATVESVMPIIDVAVEEAHRLIISRWYSSPDWLRIHVAPILQCDDQKRAAWAALEAVQWTNGSGLDVSFGPACDYVLATITRILSFHSVPMFTNAGFSEFFQVKSSSLLTRVGPLQEHVSMTLEQMFHQFKWSKSQLLYEKTFWESELREAGFCKLLMNGLYLRSVEKKWDLKMEARIVPSTPHSLPSEKRSILKNHLIDAVGINYGGGRLKTVIVSWSVVIERKFRACV